MLIKLLVDHVTYAGRVHPAGEVIEVDDSFGLRLVEDGRGAHADEPDAEPEADADEADEADAEPEAEPEADEPEAPDPAPDPRRRNRRR